MEFEVIKEYSGIKVGSIVKIAPDSQQYMLEKGYIKPLAPKKVEVKGKKADSQLKKRKKKIDPEAQDIQNK